MGEAARNLNEQSFTRDRFDPGLVFKIEEASGDVDGKHVLAKMTGQFFVPGGISRNNRYYPPELWERVCKDEAIKSRLGERRMYGTIGHEQKIDDNAVLEGRISHIVTMLEVRGEQGYGEVLILDTPAGRILNTLGRAGSKLFTSSRANGTFKGEMKGVPVVNPETYVLDTFDFVLDPGFVKANPELAEAIDHIPAGAKPPQQRGNKTMDPSQALMESVTKENATFRLQLAESATQMEKTKNENALLKEQVRVLSEKSEKGDHAAKVLKRFRVVGNTPEEIEKAFKVAETKLAAYEALGKPEDIKLALTEGKKLGLQIAKEREEIGDPVDVQKALDLALETKAAYENLGTPKDLAKVCDGYEKLKQNEAKIETEKRVKVLADELRVSEDKVRKLVARGVPDKEIKDILKDVAESARLSERHRAPEPTAGGSRPDPKAADDVPMYRRPLGERLMDTFCAPPINPVRNTDPRA